jgi:hypothetical protein
MSAEYDCGILSNLKSRLMSKDGGVDNGCKVFDRRPRVSVVIRHLGGAGGTRHGCCFSSGKSQTLCKNKKKLLSKIKF